MVGLISQLLWTIFRILFSGLYDLWLKKVNFTNSHNCVFLFQVLGSPSEETWPGISHSEELVNYNFPKYPSEALVKRAPRLDPDGIDLVSKFLLYEAKKRISAKDAIKHSYFDSLGQGVRKIADGKLEAYYFFSELPFCHEPKLIHLESLGRAWKLNYIFSLTILVQSIFSVPGIHLSKDPGYRSSAFPHSSGKSRRQSMLL